MITSVHSRTVAYRTMPGGSQTVLIGQCGADLRYFFIGECTGEHDELMQGAGEKRIWGPFIALTVREIERTTGVSI